MATEAIRHSDQNSLSITERPSRPPRGHDSDDCRAMGIDGFSFKSHAACFFGDSSALVCRMMQCADCCIEYGNNGWWPNTKFTCIAVCGADPVTNESAPKRATNCKALIAASRAMHVRQFVSENFLSSRQFGKLFTIFA